MKDSRSMPEGAPDDSIFTDRRRRRALPVAVGVVLAVALAVGFWAWRGSSSGAPDRLAGRAEQTGGMMGDMPGMATGGGTVRLTSAQLREFGVTFGSVEQRTLESSVRTSGTVVIDETRLTQVAARFGGFVERLFVDKTGQRVARGQPLMDVYSPELLAAQEELLIAADLQKGIGESMVPGVPGISTNLVAAARRRLELAEVSQAQIDEILRAGKARHALTLYAPASGVVLAKNVVRGQSIEPGQMLYVIADLRVVWIDIALRGADAGTVREGSRATAVIDPLAGQSFVGRVSFVYPMLDSATRTVRARVEVANTSGLLKPGMYATVTLASPARAALTLPTSAVLHTGERAIVFVDMGGGELMPHEVMIGRTIGEYTEVLSGVELGQRVVTSAQFLLDSESNMADVMRGMMGQMGAQDAQSMKGMPDMTGMDMRGADVKDAMKDMKDSGGASPGMKMPAVRR